MIEQDKKPVINPLTILNALIFAAFFYGFIYVMTIVLRMVFEK